MEPLREKLGDAEGALSDMTAAIDGLADDLSSEAITEKQAMARLANLADEVQRRRQGLAEENPVPKLASNLAKLGMARELASALQEGRMKDAAQKVGGAKAAALAPGPVVARGLGSVVLGGAQAIGWVRSLMWKSG